MLIGLAMILVPIIVFVVTIPYSSRLKPGLRATYLVLGGLVVFVGTGVSVYFAFYSGDQGGIAAYFFQKAVISVYLVISVAIVILNWFLRKGFTKV